MIFIIKNGKFYNFIERLFYANLFVYNFLIVLSYSAAFSQVQLVHKIVAISIKITFLIIILINLFDFLRGKFSLKELCVFFIFGLLLLISYKNFQEGTNLVALLYIAASRHKNINIIIRVYIYSIIIGIIFNFLSQFVFLIHDGSSLFFRYGKERMRFALGFSFPTFISHFYLGLVCAIGLVGFIKNNYIYLILFLINIILFILNDTKNVFICVNIFLILHFILINYYSVFLYKIISISSILSCPLGALLIYVISLNYNPNNIFFKLINRLTTGRISLNYSGIINWGVKLFGQTTNMNIYTETYNYIDSSFMNILLQSGLIVLLLIIFVMIIATYSAYKEKKISLILSFLVMSLHGIFDTQFNVIPFNPTILYIYPLVVNFFNLKYNNE